MCEIFGKFQRSKVLNPFPIKNGWSKLGLKSSIRRPPIVISGESIIFAINYQLVRNFDRGPSDRGFCAYFRPAILYPKLFEWTLDRKRVKDWSQVVRLGMCLKKRMGEEKSAREKIKEFSDLIL